MSSQERRLFGIVADLHYVLNYSLSKFWDWCCSLWTGAKLEHFINFSAPEKEFWNQMFTHFSQWYCLVSFQMICNYTFFFKILLLQEKVAFKTLGKPQISNFIPVNFFSIIMKRVAVFVNENVNFYFSNILNKKIAAGPLKNVYFQAEIKTIKNCRSPKEFSRESWMCKDK